jgi:primosomal protein N' (replication factor Y)
MYITVKLINGFQEPLTYKIPESWPTPPVVGQIVVVPLQQRSERALVSSIFQELPVTAKYKVRDILALEQMPDDPSYHQFIQRLSTYYALDPRVLYRRMRHSIAEKQDEYAAAEAVEPPCAVQLTAEQQTVVDYVKPIISKPVFQATLLHGVTGSGKTEVYKQLITHAFAQNKSTLLLLPEVSLAVNFTNLLRMQLASTIPVYGFHSASSVKDKRELWQHLLAQKPMVIVGVHMPVLLPIAQLGLILIDEEHEIGYQEKKHPRINTKEAAIMRAQLADIPILLGSATPSLSSLHAVAEHGWKLFTLKQRFAGAFPKISLVPLKTEKRRKEFWISRDLEIAINDRLAKKEQVIIFLNRRGHSFFVQCTVCSSIFSCGGCSVSLTYHDDNMLICHYCGESRTLPESCYSCQASADTFLKKGVGTQQLMGILQRLFPAAKIDRADADSTRNKRRWQKTCDDFRDRKTDILVGTQTITKGYHFPGVTLVGIIWAELNLTIPFYNAAENSLQQLIQVAGRAGRASAASEVIVQTFSEHPIFNYLSETSYPDFYHYEMGFRKEIGYPPALRFSEIELRYDDELVLLQEARLAADLIRQEIKQRNFSVTLLGPSKPPVSKIKGTYMLKLYLKSTDIKTALALYHALCRALQAASCRSSVSFTPNPLS